MPVLKGAARFTLCSGLTLIRTFHCSMSKEQSFLSLLKGLQIMLLYLFGFIFSVLIEFLFSAHIDAFTSKLIMLEKISSATLREKLGLIK